MRAQCAQRLRPLYYQLSAQAIYNWRRRYDGLELADLQRVRELEQDIARAARLLSTRRAEIELMQAIVGKDWELPN